VNLNSAAWEELVYNKIHSHEFFWRGGGRGGRGCKEIVAKKRKLYDKENLIQNKLDSQLFRASGPKYYLHRVRG
jgi:hypothetical protein